MKDPFVYGSSAPVVSLTELLEVQGVVPSYSWYFLRRQHHASSDDSEDDANVFNDGDGSVEINDNGNEFDKHSDHEGGLAAERRSTTETNVDHNRNTHDTHDVLFEDTQPMEFERPRRPRRTRKSGLQPRGNSTTTNSRSHSTKSSIAEEDDDSLNGSLTEPRVDGGTSSTPVYGPSCSDNRPLVTPPKRRTRQRTCHDHQSRMTRTTKTTTLTPTESTSPASQSSVLVSNDTRTKASKNKQPRFTQTHQRRNNRLKQNSLTIIFGPPGQGRRYGKNRRTSAY